MAVRRWQGDKARKLITAGFVRNLQAASILVVNRAKILLSVAGTGRQGTAQGHSAPGEPPRKQTGRLRASVAREVDANQLTARVGTNVKYGRWLELGTAQILPRPWLRRSLNDQRFKIQSILARRPPGL